MQPLQYIPRAKPFSAMPYGESDQDKAEARDWVLSNGGQAYIDDAGNLRVTSPSGQFIAKPNDFVCFDYQLKIFTVRTYRDFVDNFEAVPYGQH